jgi:hypothetical protein
MVPTAFTLGLEQARLWRIGLVTSVFCEKRYGGHSPETCGQVSAGFAISQLRQLLYGFEGTAIRLFKD